MNQLAGRSDRKKKWPAWKLILVAGIIAGTLDILAAMLVYDLILHKTRSILILQYIASSILKTSAYKGGIFTAGLGLLIHFAIAISFSALYYIIFSYSTAARKYTLFSGFIYGILVWAIMNLLIVPAVFGKPPVFDLNRDLLAGIILIIAIGLPLALTINRFGANNHKAQAGQ